MLVSFVLCAIGGALACWGVAISLLVSTQLGNFVAIGVGALLFVYGVFRSTLLRFLPRILRFAVLGLILLLAGLCTFLYFTGQQAYAQRYDEQAVILLGDRLTQAGKPSDALQKRMDAVAAYYEKNPNVWIVVSGGGDEQQATGQAAVMKAYLIGKGVESGVILTEDQSQNDLEKLAYSKALLDQKLGGTNYRAVCVTSDVHAYRVQAYCRKIQLDAALLCTPIGWYMYPTSYAQEAIETLQLWIAGT